MNTSHDLNCAQENRFQLNKVQNLVHFHGELVDVFFAVTKVTTLDEVVGDLSPATSWATKLDWVQAVVGLLEVIAYGVDLVDEVLDAVKSEVSQTLLNSAVLGDLDSLAVIFDSTSLVHQLLDGILGWVAPGDEWVGNAEHLNTGLVESDKNAVADLSESQKLEDLLGLWRDLVDTTDSNDHSQLGLIGHVKVAVGLGGLLLGDQSGGLGGVLGSVLAGLFDVLASGDDGLLLRDNLGLSAGGGQLGVASSLLGECLGHPRLGRLGKIFGGSHFEHFL